MITGFFQRVKWKDAEYMADKKIDIHGERSYITANRDKISMQKRNIYD
jgi:hypothetical protein